MTGPFRMGWSMDYPSPQNFLEPLYATTRSPAVRTSRSTATRIRRARRRRATPPPATTEAIGFYNQAEDVLLEDMPIIPLFFEVTQSVHSTDVADVVVDAFGRVDTSSLTATG